MIRWLSRLCRREAPDLIISQKIVPPVLKFTGHDEALEQRARQRREIADQIRQRAALVASGSRAGSVLKMAKRS